MIKYGPASVYFQTPIQNSELSFAQHRRIPKFASDVLFTITMTYQYRPDLLAYDLYRDPALWWVFANRNPNALINPLRDFKAGTQIFIPTLETLREYLGVA